MALPQELPVQGEVVVCKIIKVLDYGVFAELLEYENAQGFVHISQVASSWIKNIRNFVKENQIRAAKVTHINRTKQHIDLSFNKVSAGEQRAKIEAYNQLKKPQKMLEMLEKKLKVTPGSAWKEISEPLLNEYDSLYEAFQAIKLYGEDAAKGVPKKWLSHLVKLIDKNIAIPRKVISGTMLAYSTLPNGVEVVKKAMIDARDAGKRVKGADIKIVYTGSGKFAVKVVSHDYKISEAALQKALDAAQKDIEATNGKFSFERSGAK